MKVRTRIAPSPTGEMHVGSIAIALKNYAFAKKHGGQFILRLEDTDKVREVENGVEEIQKILKDFGLDWDEGPSVGGDFGPYIQSARLDIYREYAQKLVDDDKAYYCFCSKERLEEIKNKAIESKVPPKYDGHCRNLSKDEVAQQFAKTSEYVIRLKVPADQSVTFNDVIRGDITFETNTIDDQVLIKSDGYPTYHMAVVVDDHLMQVTHIMRGEEWISSTPKHILLYNAFGWEMPIHAHIPVFLNPDGKGKMSKRKGTVSARSFLDRGYLPEALLNFFMILGWARNDEVEVMSLDEYIKHFDPKDVSAKSVAFDYKKLNWINGIYIRKLSLEELKNKIARFLPNDFPMEKFDAILPLVQERLETLAQIEELTSFFYRDIEHKKEELLAKATPELVKEQLDKTIGVLSNLKDWTLSNIETALRDLQAETDWKKSQYFMLIRIAATGKSATPPLFETLHVIGQTETVKRLRQAGDLV